MKRYQECNYYEKLWRRRWKLAVPFVAIYYFVARKKIHIDIEVDNEIVHTNHFEYMSWKLCWKLAAGDASIKMNDTYTIDEVWQRIDDITNQR